MHLTLNTRLRTLVLLLGAALPDPAHAYMGPGLGLGVITTSLGILGAILLGLVSLLWYPMKRLVRWLLASVGGGSE